ncbi:hypothetical protein EV126DRAFT_178964 [Verticillium dahliae]|nr:hypothetical protein EV126DRAFT_178964 [Verticillium dahliae]
MALLQGLWEGLRVLLLWLIYPIMDPKLAITIASELYSYQVACNKMMQNIHRADKIQGAICKRGFLHTVATGVEKAQAAQSRPLTAMYSKIFAKSSLPIICQYLRITRRNAQGMGPWLSETRDIEGRNGEAMSKPWQ